MNVVAFCSLLLLLPVKPSYNDAMAICLDISIKSENQGEDPALMISLAYVESRLKYDAVSKAGAVGPLQVIPKFWPGEYISAGIIAWKYWKKRAGTVRDGLAMYNAGKNPSARAYRHADRVLLIKNNIKGMIGVY
jgi:hypothetical protein